MMGFFQRRRVPDRTPIRSIRAGQRIYAVGDIHGRLDLLDVLMAMIERDEAGRGPSETQLVFLGDLIDRGPDSAGVIERLIALAGQRPARFILGNHEEIFLRILEGDVESLRLFVRIGGRETILSYGIAAREYERASYPELLAMIQAAVPPSHIAFLDGFEDRIEIGDYVFVHAGMRPGIPMAGQRASDMRWIRNSFLDRDWEFGKLVVHGHSVSDDVVVRPTRIGIDTGAYASGRLTALGLENEDQWFLTTAETEAARACA
jgi:serine/threonine protein phosphatase 1